MRVAASFLAIFALITSANGQRNEIDLAQIAEDLIHTQEEGVSYEELYESLAIRLTNKLDLNSATTQDLHSLYILTNTQISQLRNYLETHGKMISTHELQIIPGFDLTTVRRVLPFVTIASQNLNQSLKERIKNSSNNFFLLRYSSRLEEQVGYTAAMPDSTFQMGEDGSVTDTLISIPTRYQGSPSRIYGRLKIANPGDFSVGVTFEKDPGELLEFSDRIKGFDFYSYHLLLENRFGFDRIVLGDFQIQAGQSLVLTGGFAPGKGAQTIQSVRRTSLGLLPYTSALESGFFRGIALTKSMGKITSTLFFSRLRQDGIIQTNETEESQLSDFVNSIQRSGLHRTARELEAKDAFLESTYGLTLEYEFSRSLKLGAVGIQNTFGVPLMRRSNNYSQFEFQGSENQLLSTYLNYDWNNFSFFSEAAISKSGGKGMVSGLIASLHQKLDFAALHRSYDRDFHSFYGNSFSEGSRNINEKGTYLGIQLTPNRRQMLNAYFDFFQFPWLRFRVNAPSQGHEYLLRYTYQPKKKIQLVAQYRKQVKERSFSEENTSRLLEQHKSNYLLAVRFEQDKLSTQTRLQGSAVTDQRFTTGIALIQDVNFQLAGIRCYTRYALFQTDNFDNAQFAYERDVLYSFSIPSYNGRGVRSYFMIRYDLSSSLSTWVRYASTIFPGQEHVGASLDRSQGDRSTEIKCMIRWKL